MKILDWPSSERPRERLLQQGASALSDAELLALFVGQGLPGCNAVDLGRQWLDQTGGLNALLNRECDHFVELSGAGVARYVLLQAALELGRRYLSGEIAQRSVMESPESVKAYLGHELAGATREHFGCLFLDAQHRVIKWQVLFSGTINAAAVYPRVIVEASLSLNASAVILAHNHPSGVCEPSSADQTITQRISEALALIDVKVLDHLIIAGDQSMSFAQRGLL